MFDSTRYEGQTLIVSIWEKEASFQPNTIVLSERQIKGTIAYRNVYPAVMELMARGYFQAANLVTKRIEIDDIAAEGGDLLSSEKSQIKILVKAPS